MGKHHTARVTLDHGAYYFLTSENPETYLVFSELSDLRVDLGGSKIYFAHPFLQGFLVSNCQRVTLTNFEADFLNLPYTHVQLESVDPQQRTLAYTTLPDWADPETFNGETTPLGPPVLWAVAFRNGNIVPGTSRMQVAQPISDGVLRLVQDNTPWTQPTMLSTFLPGDTIVVTQRGGESLINASRSDAITFSNFTVHASSAIAVLLNSVSHSTVDHVRVMPRPGSGLIASNADGIHFVLSGPDNHIRNSFVTRTLDDALAIDSLDLATVTSQSGPRQLTVQRSFYRRFPNGTAVNFVDPATAGELDGGTIVSQDPPDSNSPTLDGSVELTFDQDLPTIAAGFGMAFANASDRGAGSSIEGNEVREISFGRGVYVAGAKGVTVEHNTIGHTSNGGIAVSQNVTAFPSPPSHDITIQFNEIHGSLGPMASGSGTPGHRHRRGARQLHDSDQRVSDFPGQLQRHDSWQPRSSTPAAPESGLERSTAAPLKTTQSTTGTVIPSFRSLESTQRPPRSWSRISLSLIARLNSSNLRNTRELHVHFDPPTVAISVQPSTIVAGNPVTLIWIPRATRPPAQQAAPGGGSAGHRAVARALRLWLRAPSTIRSPAAASAAAQLPLPLSQYPPRHPP